jgi:hypothetical protein
VIRLKEDYSVEVSGAKIYRYESNVFNRTNTTSWGTYTVNHPALPDDVFRIEVVRSHTDPNDGDYHVEDYQRPQYWDPSDINWYQTNGYGRAGDTSTRITLRGFTGQFKFYVYVMDFNN